VNQIFVQIGKVIASSGASEFVQNMHELINLFVPVGGTHVAKWVVDERIRKVTAVLCFGAFSSEVRLSHHGPGHLHTFGPDAQDPVLSRIVSVDDPQLLHRNHRADFGAGDPEQREAVYQCILLSRRTSQRFSVSLQRTSGTGYFSLSELSTLKRLADVILPMVERHAFSQARGPQAGVSWLETGGNGAPSVKRRFEERVKSQGIVLSGREKEVCIALLLGNTLPTIARELCVSESTAATYMRRAAIKLNLNGRHGLLKWMLGFDMQQSSFPTPASINPPVVSSRAVSFQMASYRD
jgi:DNA-binding CsgD family transcriptional regulator